MLLAHAATVDWRGRSQRWEWALDGSRLGVADWHLQRDESFASAAWRTPHRAHGARLEPVRLAGARASRRPPRAGGSHRLADRRRGRPAAARTARAPRRRLALDGDHADGHRARRRRPSRAPAGHAGRRRRSGTTRMERQRMSASLFQHLHEGLLITDADLRALDVNPAYTQILGVPRDELLGTVPLAAAADAGRPGGAPAARRDVGQPARHRQLARRAARAPAQRRALHAAGHHLHRARARRRTCATTCS